jgi:DNA-binding MarR family transcriptional regulator
MISKKEYLFTIFDNLMKIKGKCSCEILSECGLSDITVKQIGYLRAIDGHEEVTFSKLAKITKNSKPTITEMIQKFVNFECVYREKCPNDGRVVYIHLTEKGKMIARSEENSLMKIIEKMVTLLDEREIDRLIEILEKII